MARIAKTPAQSSSKTPSSVWRCLIPNCDLTSTNTLERMHWHAKAAKLERLMNLVRVYGGMGDLPQFDCKVSILIARLWGKRQRALDDDNAMGGCKLLIDVMKKPRGGTKRGLGIIDNDNPGTIDLAKPHQTRNPHGDTCDILILIAPYNDKSTLLLKMHLAKELTVHHL